jgi:hypothetical protein
MNNRPVDTRRLQLLLVWDSTSRGEISLAVAESWRIRHERETPSLEYQARAVSHTKPRLEL